MTENLDQPRLLVDLPCETGENPMWHADEGCLYWTDIPRRRLHRFDPRGGEVATFDMGAEVGGFTVQADGALLLFMARGAVRTWHAGRFRETILESVPAETDGRFNDVIADPAGRVFCGTMATANHGGRFYRLELDGSLTLLREGMGTPNGMGFSGDRQTFYHSDSRTCVIHRYAYDAATGALSNHIEWLHVTGTETVGRPDGLTVDAEDCIWSARWDGGRLVRLTPGGAVMREVLFPVRKVSCLTFGGPDYATAYVTTAGGQLRPGEGAQAGGIFAVDLGVRGRPEFRSRVNLT